MKVEELKKVLDSVNPNWDVMIACDENCRDLINGYRLFAYDDNPAGFIELKSVNYIGFGRQKAESQLNQIRKALHKENFDEDDFSAEVAHILGEVIA